MRCCIVGGGLTGLVAGLALSAEHEVDLFEKRPVLGGCLSSIDRGSYTIESFYHHCFGNDQHLFALLDRFGLLEELEWLSGSDGYYVDGRIYPLSTAREIIAYPHLSVIDKARLAWLTLQSKRFDRKALDDVPAKEFILGHVGRSGYSSFFEPLLRSKFGPMRDRVSAAWLVSRIAIRSSRDAGGERLGYPRRGFASLIDRLEEALERQGGSVLKETPVTTMQRDGLAWIVNGTRYDTVVSTIPPQSIAAISGVAFPEIPYQGAACMTIGLEREVTDGIYWLNMKDEAPYGAVVAHTNFAPYERYGEHLVYLASYYTDMLPPGHGERMLADFKQRFGVRDDEIHWHHLQVDPCAGPIYTTGYRRLIPNYEQYGLYMAGMFSWPNYPERSMEGSVIAGEQVASCVRRRAAHE